MLKMLVPARFVFHTLCITQSLAQIPQSLQSPPRMVKQPPTDEILFHEAVRQSDQDKPITIECEAEGVPALKYRWIKNGKPFDWRNYDDRISQEPGRGTLNITVPRHEDVGQYQCFATNEYGTATSNSVFVHKSVELENFKTEADNEPQNYDTNEGEPYGLRCDTPDGWPKSSVYWLIQTPEGDKSINSSRITLDPEGSLWFSSVSEEDASVNSSYACSTNERKIIGKRVKLNVLANSASQNRHEPIRQYVTRKNEWAYLGKKAELYCIFGGTPVPEIQWKKNGIPIPRGGTNHVTMRNYGKSLFIDRVIADDEGHYSCEASNGVGSAKSYSIGLTVFAAPYFTVEPEIVNAAEDERVEFSCVAKGVPEPQIKWMYNGMPIEQAPLNARRRIQTNKIIIDRLNKNDTGNYGCNATNRFGYVYKDVYVNVLALAPEFTDIFYLTVSVVDEAATLKCLVFGAPKPLVKWIRLGKELTNDRRYRIESNGDLIIKKANFSDSGEYTCHATNRFGSNEGHVKLKVLEEGRLWQEAAEMNFLHLYFQKLTLKMWVPASFVFFTLCITQSLAQPTVEDVPNPPYLKGIRCKEFEATIEWESKGDNKTPNLRYTIQYNTSFTPDSWDIAAENVSASESSYRVPLSPWSNYTFRVIAWNKIGQSLPSAVSGVCSTEPDVPAKNPEIVEAQGDKPDNMVISWKPMPEIEHNAPRFQYLVMWKRAIEGADWHGKLISDWKVDRITVPDLPAYQPYKIMVLAINENGKANVATQEITGYSGNPNSLPTPRDLTITVIDSKTGLIRWETATDESVISQFKGYKIQTWTDEEGMENMREMFSSNDSSRALINKFVPFSKNYARIVAYTDFFDGPPSETISFNTPEGIPEAVPSLQAHPLGSTAFLLKWQKPLQTNGVLTGYKIYYEDINSTKIEPLFQRREIEDPNQLHAKLAGLKPNTKFRITIRAATQAGEGNEFFIETRTLPPMAKKPDVPEFTWKNEAPVNGLANVRVQWLPNVQGYSGSYFQVMYKLRGESVFEISKPELEEDYIILRGLNRGATYKMKMLAVDGDYHTESNIQDVET
ncbi:neuroglian-like [Cloeon dipterum]|uniref:neuroglian-like n=1 Tax=Cloeon dipterum TaxID=197152 RepID=UPI00321FDDB1